MGVEERDRTTSTLDVAEGKHARVANCPFPMLSPHGPRDGNSSPEHQPQAPCHSEDSPPVYYRLDLAGFKVGSSIRRYETAGQTRMAHS